MNAGSNINITSQNNNLISGSNLSANNINLSTINGLTTITSAQDQYSLSTASTDQNYNDTSLNYNRGRVSADSNSKVLEETITTTTATQKSSNLNAATNINDCATKSCVPPKYFFIPTPQTSRKKSG